MLNFVAICKGINTTPGTSAKAKFDFPILCSNTQSLCPINFGHFKWFLKTFVYSTVTNKPKCEINL